MPFLAARLSVPVPVPQKIGTPGCIFPYPWVIAPRLEGEPTSGAIISDMEQFARELVGFLKQLQACPTDKATAAGESCLPAGRGLPELASQAEAALQRLDDQAASAVLRRIWQQALASKWDGKPVWVHGDLVPEHLLVQDGRLCGVIGFASAAVGDPACDYAMAWTFFNGRSREIFLDGLDTDTVCRAKDWALWVALTEQGGSDEAIPVRAEHIIRELLLEQCCS